MSTLGPGPLVVVVAYDSDEVLPRALRGVEGRDVVVVDNAASQRTRELAERAGARYVAAPYNLGFAAGVNLGLDTAWDGRADVLLLNPDAAVEAPVIERLGEELHRTGTHLAAVAPRLVDADGNEQRVRWPIPSPAQMWCEAIGLTHLKRWPVFVVGAVLLLSGDALAEIGRFDERYFLYAEETDWQLRATRAGWEVGVVEDVTAKHVGAASSSDPERREQLAHASAEHFGRRWYGARGWALMRVAATLTALRRAVAGGSGGGTRGLHIRTVRRLLRGPVRDAQRRGAATP